MPLSERERERLADDIYSDRCITGSVYCGKCGYDLHSLPYIYRCPECGQEYNARPLEMKGIFLPHFAEAPLREMAIVLVCGAGAIVMLGSGVSPMDIWRLVFGLTMGACCVMEVGSAWQKFFAYRKARAILRRIKRGDA